MSQSVAVWIVVLAALVGANLPFFINQRLLGVVPLKAPKGLALRLAELVLLYFAVGALGLLLEQRAGRIAPQGWEFYAVTAAFFLTLAFPGFVYRYLYKRHY
jgi:hypothetical protein